jgi:hypothetical protein
MAAERSKGVKPSERGGSVTDGWGGDKPLEDSYPDFITQRACVR